METVEPRTMVSAESLVPAVLQQLFRQCRQPQSAAQADSVVHRLHDPLLEVELVDRLRLHLQLGLSRPAVAAETAETAQPVSGAMAEMAAQL